MGAGTRPGGLSGDAGQPLPGWVEDGKGMVLRQQGERGDAGRVRAGGNDQGNLGWRRHQRSTRRTDTRPSQAKADATTRFVPAPAKGWPPARLKAGCIPPLPWADSWQREPLPLTYPEGGKPFAPEDLQGQVRGMWGESHINVVVAEEIGRYGAQGFCTHPLAQKIGIINELDVCGTNGPALIYETSSGQRRVDRDRSLVGPTLASALLGKVTGTRQSILPAVVGRFQKTPHIALSGAFLALRAPDFNGWPRRWVWGQRRDWDPGRTCLYSGVTLRAGRGLGVSGQ